MTLFSVIGRVYLLALLLNLAGMLTAPSFAQQAAEIRTGVVKIVITAPAAKIGSGIVVRRDANEAYIVTAAHVVNDAKEFFVQFYSTAEHWEAEIKHIEYDNVAKGFALLRVVGKLPAGVKALPLATEVTMVGGEQVRIIGHQASTGDWGVLAGIVSGRMGRDVVIQAPIQEQTSGGPVVLDGRVVGLVQNRDPSGAFGDAVTAQAIREYVEGLQVSLDPVSPPKDKIGEAPCTLSGLVFDRDSNRPLSGVWIDLYRDPSGIQWQRPTSLKKGVATTGPDGKFSINCSWVKESQFPLLLAVRHQDWVGTHIIGSKIERTGQWEGINIPIQMSKVDLVPLKEITASFSSKNIGADWFIVGDIENKSSRSFRCIRARFKMVTSYQDRMQGEPVRDLGFIDVEVRDLGPNEKRPYQMKLPKRVGLGWFSNQECK